MEKNQHRKTNSIIQLLIVVVVGIVSISNSFAQSRQKLPCLDRRFSIIVNIVHDSLGQPGIILQDVLDGIDAANTAWEDICVSFEVCEVRNIYNFQYNDLDTTLELPELMIKYYEEYRINMFVVNSTTAQGSFATLGGIAKVDDGLICMEKSAGPGTYVHEMGHYFGLPHTFDTPGELVDGSNCATTGDEICDTPADPYPQGSVDANCRFIGMIQDANGDYYTPDVGNPMSYYPGNCKCLKFTHDQYWKMANTYLNSNPKMW